MDVPAVVPMFPLGSIVLPGALLPLQVFEPRYLQMVHDLLRSDDDQLFGTVLIERGHEVGGDDERADVGTLVRVADMRVLDDGRYLLAAIAIARIRVERWLPDDPYPMAQVSAWPDEPNPPSERSVEHQLEAIVTNALALADRVREMGHDLPRPDEDLSDDPAVALYQIAARSPLGPADRHRILSAPSVVERCGVVAEAIDDALAVIEFHRS